jgi:hypothetical protein
MEILLVVDGEAKALEVALVPAILEVGLLPPDRDFPRNNP